MIQTQKLKKGDVLSETQYYTVVSQDAKSVTLRNDEGERIEVSLGYAKSFLNSADQFTEVVKVTKTELAEIFLRSSRVAMTVNFNKQVKPEDVTKGIVSLYEDLGIGMTKADFQKKVKAALNIKGEERTMVGRHYGHKDVNELVYAA